MSAPEIEADPSTASELSAFQQTILTVLAEESRYGLAIKRELEAYYVDDVNHGQLYPNLDELVEMGLIAKAELDGRTNEYELTEAGYDALLTQLAWQFDQIGTDGRAEDLRMLLGPIEQD